MQVISIILTTEKKKINCSLTRHKIAWENCSNHATDVILFIDATDFYVGPIIPSQM